MKKLCFSLPLVLLFTYANAGGMIEPKKNVDEFVKADNNVTNSVDSKDRSLYMPRIVTPDSLKSGVYAGLGISASTLAANTTPSIIFHKDGNNRMVDLSVIAGYNFNKYLSAESRALISTAYDKDIDFKSWGLFLKPKYEVYNNLNLYSLIGVGKNSAEDINDYKLKMSKTSLQIGVGANYKLKDNFKVFADYTYLGKDSKGKYNANPAVMKASAITTGVTYDF